MKDIEGKTPLLPKDTEWLFNEMTELDQSIKVDEDQKDLLYGKQMQEQHKPKVSTNLLQSRVTFREKRNQQLRRQGKPRPFRYSKFNSA